MKNKIYLFLLIMFFLILALLPRQDIQIVNLNNTFAAMSMESFFGTDNLGRDVFSLVIEGAWRTIQVVFFASAISLLIGIFLGVIAGYYEGYFEVFIQIITDLFLIMPSFILAIIIIAIFGLSPITAGIALGVCEIGAYSNQAMGLTKKIKNEDFIIAEKTLGIYDHNILFKHIVPNIITPIFTSFGNKASNFVLAYAGLAFIGLGTDRTQPDWGTMIYQYRLFIISNPMLLIWPMLGILLMTLFFHLAFDQRDLTKRKRGNLF